MRTILCFLGLLAVAAAFPYSDDRIVGGDDVTSASSYPWQVSLRRNVGESHFCGGSIISANWIMTACHCSVSSVKVAMGSTTLTPKPNVMIPGSFTCHPQYDSGTINNDFAVIELSSSAPINGVTIKAVALPSSNAVFTGYATTTGWGYTTGGSSPGNMPNTLQVATVPLVDQESCNSDWTTLPNQQRITTAMQCAGGSGSTSCMGDSGGPLVQQVNGVWTLIGAVSWGSSSCATNQPAVYARIAYARSWISSTTGV